MMKSGAWSRFGAAVVMGLCGWTAAAQAQEARPSWYVQAGAGESSAHAAGVGVTLPWPSAWQWSLGSGVVRGHWDLSLTGWSARPVPGAERRDLGVLGADAALRWRGDGGRSPWFWEAGTGLSLASRHHIRDGQEFSTRYNFASHIGGGVLFGAQDQHEVSLRLQHTSNAHIKTPNPGANFLLLRYAHAF